MLVERATLQAIKRVRTSLGESRTEVDVTEEDFNAALLKVRPSAMREIVLEAPKVKWGEIGGQQHVKTILQKAIEWPLKVSRCKSFFQYSHLIIYSILTL